MKTCPNCEAEFDTKHSKCQDCRGVKPIALGAKNFKWRVAIEVCPVGHKFVPIKGVEGCGKCKLDNDKNLQAVPGADVDTVLTTIIL